MKYSSEERLYLLLESLCEDKPGGIQTAELAHAADLSRNAASHYLNRLLEKGMVKKTGTKGALWKPVDPEEQGVEERDVLSEFIGYDGSCEEVISACRSAASYPPSGLPLLLCGPSGVGKSALANLVYRYTVQCGGLKASAPFVTLNCADYADNPQLLGGMLFGYKKGTFTGADRDHVGLVQTADGGILFLDEVHRLSFENQEKLFLLLDQGKYRPMGESQRWRRAEIRLICATTENVDKVLLQTFRRRIPVRVDIPSYLQRPIEERLEIVIKFCREEAVKIGQDVIVTPPVLSTLLFLKQEGNIGAVVNMVKRIFANAFLKKEQRGEFLLLTAAHLPQGASLCPPEFEIQEMMVYRDKPGLKAIDFCISEDTCTSFLRMLVDCVEYPEKTESLGGEFEKVNQELFLHLETGSTKELYGYTEFAENILEGICEKYGFADREFIRSLSVWYRLCASGNLRKLPEMESLLERLHSFYPYAGYTAEQMTGQILKRLSEPMQRRDVFECICCVAVQQKLKDMAPPLRGLIVSHGNSTATSIATVANQVGKTFVFEAIDMPMDTQFAEILHKIKEFVRAVNTRQGLILLVDMGSCSQMYTSIKNDVEGELLIVNNVTTAMAIDMALQMMQRTTFQELAKRAASGIYQIESQYYESVLEPQRVIISCVSGVGIAEKVKAIFEERVDTEKLELLTAEYDAIKRALDTGNQTYLARVRMIVTTSDLSDHEMLILNLADLWTTKGTAKLWKGLSGFVTKENFERLKKELFRLFSKEGVKSRLSFLNPDVIIDEIERVLKGYETRYHLRLKDFQRMNLLLHISTTVERLLVGDRIYRERAEKKEFTEEEKEFFDVSRNVFREIVAKYRIDLDEYELSLLYELLKNC